MIKILLTVAVLGSVGSFAGPSMAQGKQDAQGGERWFSFPWTDSTSPQSDQRDEGQPKVRREQPEISTSPKVATAPRRKQKRRTRHHGSILKKSSSSTRNFWNGEIANCFMRLRPNMMLVPLAI